MSASEITIRRPDDWHLHLRDGALLKAVLAATARQFARAIVMPNLSPPVTRTAQAAAYRDRILAALPAGVRFAPLMTLYLTDRTSAADLVAGFEAGVVTAAKLYPAGATTNSEAGVTDVKHIADVLDAMEKAGIPLLVHGEVTDKAVDVFDREAVFIGRILAPLAARHPALKIVLEHVTTEEGVAFVRAHAPRVATTITAHHLVINRNALFEGGIRPHMYCLPVAKREKHRLALVEAATSGEPAFFLGTDSAPHLKHTKETSCGCAGIYSAPFALETYAEVFDRAGRLDRFEAFASLNGPRFYGLPANEDPITLARGGGSRVPDEIEMGREDTIVPFRSGEILEWHLK